MRGRRRRIVIRGRRSRGRKRMSSSRKSPGRIGYRL